jgi:hypothetical protein
MDTASHIICTELRRANGKSILLLTINKGAERVKVRAAMDGCRLLTYGSEPQKRHIGLYRRTKILLQASTLP